MSDKTTQLQAFKALDLLLSLTVDLDTRLTSLKERIGGYLAPPPPAVPGQPQELPPERTRSPILTKIETLCRMTREQNDSIADLISRLD